MERQYQILIIDDDNDILSRYQIYFTKQGFTVKVAHDGIEGLEKLREIDFDVALVDINMPNMNGLEMIKQANEENIDTDMVILSGEGEGNRNDAIAAINIGVSAWFEKSRGTMDDLLNKIKELSGFISINEIERLLSALYQPNG